MAYKPERLAEARGSKTQASVCHELSKRVNKTIATQQLSHWERSGRPPRTDYLEALANIYNVPMDWFFDRDEEETV